MYKKKLKKNTKKETQEQEWAEVKKTGQRERGDHKREEFKNKTNS
jgi:hypothetical protein